MSGKLNSSTADFKIYCLTSYSEIRLNGDELHNANLDTLFQRLVLLALCCIQRVCVAYFLDQM